MLLTIYYVIIQKNNTKVESSRKSELDFMIKFCKFCKRACEWSSLVKILYSCHCNIFGINRRCLRKIRIKNNNEQPRLLKRLSFSLFCFMTMPFLPQRFCSAKRILTVFLYEIYGNKWVVLRGVGVSVKTNFVEIRLWLRVGLFEVDDFEWVNKVE